MNDTGRSATESRTFAGAPDRPTCPLCASYLREGHIPDEENPHGLCDPCLDKVRRCTPFAGTAASAPQPLAGPAPAGANLLELSAGLLLVHDALHPGEPLYLREALAAYGVEVDHVQAHKVVNKLRRRHGLVVRGEARQAGYALDDWTYEAKRVRSSLRGG